MPVVCFCAVLFFFLSQIIDIANSITTGQPVRLYFHSHCTYDSISQPCASSDPFFIPIPPSLGLQLFTILSIHFLSLSPIIDIAIGTPTGQPVRLYFPFPLSI